MDTLLEEDPPKKPLEPLPIDLPPPSLTPRSPRHSPLPSSPRAEPSSPSPRTPVLLPTMRSSESNVSGVTSPRFQNTPSSPRFCDSPVLSSRPTMSAGHTHPLLLQPNSARVRPYLSSLDGGFNPRSASAASFLTTKSLPESPSKLVNSRGLPKAWEGLIDFSELDEILGKEVSWYELPMPEKLNITRQCLELYEEKLKHERGRMSQSEPATTVTSPRSSQMPLPPLGSLEPNTKEYSRKLADFYKNWRAVSGRPSRASRSSPVGKPMPFRRVSTWLGPGMKAPKTEEEDRALYSKQLNDFHSSPEKENQKTQGPFGMATGRLNPQLGELEEEDSLGGLIDKRNEKQLRQKQNQQQNLISHLRNASAAVAAIARSSSNARRSSKSTATGPGKRIADIKNRASQMPNRRTTKMMAHTKVLKVSEAMGKMAEVVKTTGTMEQEEEKVGWSKGWSKTVGLHPHQMAKYRKNKADREQREKEEQEFGTRPAPPPPKVSAVTKKWNKSAVDVLAKLKSEDKKGNSILAKMKDNKAKSAISAEGVIATLKKAPLGKKAQSAMVSSAPVVSKEESQAQAMDNTADSMFNLYQKMRKGGTSPKVAAEPPVAKGSIVMPKKSPNKAMSAIMKAM